MIIKIKRLLRSLNFRWAPGWTAKPPSQDHQDSRVRPRRLHGAVEFNVTDLESKSFATARPNLVTR